MTNLARRTKTGLALSLLVIFSSSQAIGDNTAAPMSRAVFDQLMQDISNWGRWGKEDELGSLNLITPAKRIAAAKLVKKGISVSLAKDMNTVRDEVNQKPFKHTVTTEEFGDHETAGDIYSVEYHGFAHSHIDGLPHFSHKGFLYNGVPISAIKPAGVERLGIAHAGVEGIFTRGVLIDMPAHLGVAHLAPGTAITIKDIEQWEKSNKIKVGSGDVLLLRTGRWAINPDDNSDANSDAKPELQEMAIAGFHASVAGWLKERDVAVVGSDAISDVMPSGVDGLPTPLHELVLVGLGMPILDNLDLELLAATAVREKRTTFLFTAAPLRVVGGTGSPLNPLAIF